MRQETYELMDRVRNRYGISVEVYFPRAETVEAMVREHGLDLFYDSVALRQMCCGVRKVEPLERALAELDAWITGLRPDQSITRTDVRAVEVDAVHGGRIKLNPLVRWRREDVMAYVDTHHVPINRCTTGLSERRVCAVHALDPAGGGRARRALVVGEPRNTRMWHSPRPGGEGVRHLTARRGAVPCCGARRPPPAGGASERNPSA